MKYNLSALLATILLAGCTSISPYEHASNWLIRQNDVPQFFALADVIYLTPTMTEQDQSPLNSMTESERNLIAYHDAFGQTSGVFGTKCRIFVPKINLLTTPDFIQALQHPQDKQKQAVLQQSIRQAEQALDCYITHFHTHGHPFILMADGHGAWALYQAIKDNWDVTVDNGFVAAYLPGMPPLTKQEIEQDFPLRKLTPAQHDCDYGVIITWNAATTQPTAQSPFWNPKQTAMNPITWEYGQTQAPKEKNRFSLLYQWNKPKPQDRQQKLLNPCGARLDPQSGTLILTEVSKALPMKRLTGKDGLLHGHNLALFAGNIAYNARKRTEQMLKDRKWGNTR